MKRTATTVDVVALVLGVIGTGAGAAGFFKQSAELWKYDWPFITWVLGAYTVALVSLLWLGGRALSGRGRSFMRDDRGLETVEYAILAGVVVAGLVTIVLAIGAWVARRWFQFKNGLRA